jgi:DNA-binding CsgD family transcriptional regulator
MLVGAAEARAENYDTGLATLDDAAAFARSAVVHPAITAEIDYYRALNLRQVALRQTTLPERERLLDVANSRASDAAASRADIITARAAALRGWLAVDQQRYHDAHGLFVRAERQILACASLDVHLAALVQHAIAQLELDLRTATFRGAHRARYAADQVPQFYDVWSAPIPRLQTLIADAWAFALDGDVTCALDRAWDAEKFGKAVSPAWRVVALAERAAIMRAVGDVASSRKVAEDAAGIAQSVPWSETRGEEHLCLLTLVDEIIRFDVGAGIALFERYQGIRADHGNLLPLRDPRTVAQEQYTAGLVARESGDDLLAQVRFREAYRAYRKLGVLWKAALTLIEVDRTRFGLSSQDAALETAVALVKDHYPTSFIVPMLGKWAASFADEEASGLKPHLREVLRLLSAGGLSPKEIAVRTGKSLHTIRSYTRDLHAAFNVRSTRELLARARERGFI